MTLKKEILELKEKNLTLIKTIDLLEDEIAVLHDELKKECRVQFIKNFEKNPKEFLDLPMEDFLSNRFIKVRYFRKIAKYIQYSNSLRDFFNQPDNDLLKYVGLGRTTLHKIRLIQRMMENNYIDRELL
jgi:hypothetical protein